MNIDIYTHTVELLDRKFRFIMESHPSFFMLELKKFILFLTDNELIRDASERLKQEVERRKNEYLAEVKGELERARIIKGQLVAMYPQLADQPDDSYTFAEFDRLIAGDDCLTVPEFRENTLADETKVGRVILILSVKLNTLREKIELGDLSIVVEANLAEEIEYLSKLHQYNYEKLFGYRRISPGQALIQIEELIRLINPRPSKMAGVIDEKFIDQFVVEGKRLFNKWVDEATYAGTVQHKYALANSEAQSNLDQLRQKAQRVYEGVRQEIGTTRLRSQVLDRYATRCKLYNQEAIRNRLVKGMQFLPKREAREECLTQDLALYLYDQGITTIYKFRLGNREFDLADLDSKTPMVIEAKAYKGRETTRLRKGIYQLLDYLCFVDSRRHVDEGYYVYFRVGGPVIRFEDHPIRIGGFRIHPILVDLAESKESGSRSEKPVTITRKEIESGLTQYKRASSQLSRKTAKN